MNTKLIILKLKSISINVYIGPLLIKEPNTGVITVIGVTNDAPDSLKNTTVVATYARVNQVLPWIYEVLGYIPKNRFIK